MSHEEVMRRHENNEFVEKVSGVHNKKELSEFCKKIQAETVDLFQDLPYKFYFIEDYGPN